MKKSQLSLVFGLLLGITSIANAATFKSATTPISGQYNINYSYLCILDSTSTSSTPSFVTKEQEGVGQMTFTPNTQSWTATNITNALIAWVASLGSTYGNPISPASFITLTKEAPFEWGIITGKDSQAEFTTPTTSNPIPINYQTKGIGPVFITSFTNPDSSVGYALYNYDTLYQLWKRKILYFNTGINSTSSNITFIGSSTDQFGSNGAIFNYNCRAKGTMFK